VDWNIFARLGTLVVKRFEAEENPEVFLILDASPSMDFGEPTKLDWGRLVAAAVGYIALANFGSVHVAAVPPTESGFALSFRGAGQAMPYFDRLTRIKPVATENALSGVIEFLSVRKRITGAVLISDCYELESLTKLIAFLRHRNARTFCVHTVCHEEMVPASLGTVLVDAETGRTLDLDAGRETLTAYRRAFRRHCLRVEGVCKRYRAGYLRFDTRTPLERAVLDLLKARRLRA
jgi:uncharacterized protein (DUF58 family)